MSNATSVRQRADRRRRSDRVVDAAVLAETQRLNHLLRVRIAGNVFAHTRHEVAVVGGVDRPDKAWAEYDDPIHAEEIDDDRRVALHVVVQDPHVPGVPHLGECEAWGEGNVRVVRAAVRVGKRCLKRT